MGRRRRKNPERDAKTFVTGDLKNKVMKLMENRHRLIAPFPLDLEELYQLLWTDKQREALKVLAGREGLLRTRSQMYIREIPIPARRNEHGDVDPDRIASAVVNLPQSRPLCNSCSIPYIDLPVAMRDQVYEWAPVWMQYQQETAEIARKVEQVGEACSTYGQVFRIWPDLQGFFGEIGRDRINSMVVASRYPDAVRLFDGAQTLKPEFRPEAFEKYTMWIAESLMLPEHEGNHIAIVST